MSTYVSISAGNALTVLWKGIIDKVVNLLHRQGLRRPDVPDLLLSSSCKMHGQVSDHA